MSRLPMHHPDAVRVADVAIGADALILFAASGTLGAASGRTSCDEPHVRAYRSRNVRNH